MKLTLDQVKHVAKLANLPLTDDELETYSGQLSEILGYIENLNKVDTEGVEPTFNITPDRNVFREDEVKESLTQEQALSNASNKKDGQFVTKGVFADE